MYDVVEVEVLELGVSVMRKVREMQSFNFGMLPWTLGLGLRADLVVLGTPC